MRKILICQVCILFCAGLVWIGCGKSYVGPETPNPKAKTPGTQPQRNQGTSSKTPQEREKSEDASEERAEERDSGSGDDKDDYQDPCEDADEFCPRGGTNAPAPNPSPQPDPPPPFP